MSHAAKSMWLILSLFAIAGTSASAQVLQQTLVATRDTVLFEESDNSNGAGPQLFSGRILSGERRRSLLAFDGLATLPPGSQIVSATLTLYMSRTQSSGANVMLHRNNAAWGEAGSDSGDLGGAGDTAQNGDATWNFRVFPGQPWITPGGNFAATPSASTLVTSLEGPYDWNNPSLVADVQAWVDNPSSNHGWLLMTDEQAGVQTAMRFPSRENTVITRRPSLAITYTGAGTPPSSGVIGIPSLSAWALGLLTMAILSIGLAYARTSKRRR